MNQKKILLAGLPSTGKTTFIAALWHYVNLNITDKKLTLETLAKGEHEYLNSICNDWLCFKRVPRTPNINTKGEEVIMHLKNCLNNKHIILKIPDFSGETFNNQFESREWHSDYNIMLDDTNGILLFINALSANNRAELIIEANEAAVLLGGEKLTSNEGINFTSWSPEHTSNQVKLVDIIQFIDQHKRSILPIKLAVVISAWDVVEEGNSENKITPLEWIQLNLPLLYQYLLCNSENFNSKFYGISAQGVDYDREDEVDKVLSHELSKRIIIKEDRNYFNDITIPIVWIADENNY